MATNVFPTKQPAAAAKPPKRTNRLILWANNALNTDRLFGEKLSLRYFKRALWVALLTLIYVSLTLNAEKLVRQAYKLDREINDYRSGLTTLEAEISNRGRLPRVVQKMKERGLEESTTAPQKIVIPTQKEE